LARPRNGLSALSGDDVNIPDLPHALSAHDSP